ncbi:electron transport complex subunit RsxB [Thioflexithrix psekupsensis]|uniref:Ion-translocating oxidoreductase complex subunit B n=1 Tax=Thioflexithrix psekupsensis TaxID=1570016 RepID=A0A251X720_9GAMM|nr:electron transport complex subunit RsxB [Thioflexithrix psekupsensis]OUD13130.1 electron transport complex subunit RsxB [Thioflexithrix psekupsensis]
MLAAIISLTLLSLTLGFGLGYAARLFKVETSPVVAEIAALMPGSNCGQCGFPGCNPAAEAIANGQAAVTCCPPGGRMLAEDIAALLGVTVDLSNVEKKAPMFAAIDEKTCIGCAKCIKHCPTDAIVGAPKQIHAVIRDACIGCEACIDACPTECLQMHPFEVTLKTWRWHKPVPSALAA